MVLLLSYSGRPWKDPLWVLEETKCSTVQCENTVIVELRCTCDVGGDNDVRHADRRLVSHLLWATRSFQCGLSSRRRCHVRPWSCVDGRPSCPTAASRRASHVGAFARTYCPDSRIHCQLVPAPGAHCHRPRLSTSVQGLWRLSAVG